MKLLPATIWIFALLILLLVLVGLVPSPLMVGLGIAVSSVLVVVQAILVLKDE